MSLRVAILSPGSMGRAIGAVLAHHGVQVVTSLAGRSAATAARVSQAGFAVAADDGELVAHVDVILAILPPDQALGLARRLAPTLSRSASPPVYVDANAVAPETARRIAAIIGAAGAPFVDGGIIGGPPAIGGDGPRIYVSGPAARAVAALRSCGLDMREVGSAPGDASALKMCYAALTKGVIALGTQLAVAAGRLGVREPLLAELEASQAALLARLTRQIPTMVPKAYRWVGEMEEISRTFAACGLSPAMLSGAADVYRQVTQLSPRGDDLDSVLADLGGEAWSLREATPADAAICAQIHIYSRREMVYLPQGLHEDAETRAWMAETIFPASRVLVGERQGKVCGFVAFADGLVSNLYCDAGSRGLGLGSTLIEAAKGLCPSGLRLWVFEQNVRGRQFYERHGFATLKRTNGQSNEERCPDRLMVWLPDS